MVDLNNIDRDCVQSFFFYDRVQKKKIPLIFEKEWSFGHLIPQIKKKLTKKILLILIFMMMMDMKFVLK